MLCSGVVDYRTLIYQSCQVKLRAMDFTREGGLVWNTDTDVDIQNTIYGMGPRLGGMVPLPPGSATVSHTK